MLKLWVVDSMCKGFSQCDKCETAFPNFQAEITEHSAIYINKRNPDFDSFLECAEKVKASCPFYAVKLR